VPNSFAESADSILLIADGVGNMLRWDGRSSFAEPAGVSGPTTAPALTGSGAGAIVGAYTAYVRYLDRYGNVSNVSPASTEYDAQGATGTITNATNAVPISVTSAAHGLSNGATIKISGVEGNDAANGTWTITVVDANTFTLDNSSGDGAYRGAGTWYRGVLQISYSAIPTPSDPTVITRQILRNTDGQLRTFYVDIETTDLTSTAFTSTKTDDDLIASEAVPFFDDTDNDLAISLFTTPPNDKKVIANMLGRMFAVGDVRYSQGAAAVTFGSTTITGIGTEWTEALANRLLAIDGAPSQYTIESVDVASQTAELTEPYLGPTDPYASYAIQVSSSRRRSLDYSESFLPEAWPPTNSLDLENESQSSDITGLLRQGSFLYITHGNRMQKLTFQSDPSPITGDGAVFAAAKRGAVNHRCIPTVEDVAYPLDTVGVHAFYGNDDTPVSEEIRNIFNPRDAGPIVIQWRFKENFHAVHDPGAHLLRWFVCLDGSRYPRHCLTYDYVNKTWATEEYYRPIASSCLGRLNGTNQVYLGTDAGQVLALGEGELDGPDPQAGTTRGQPTSVGLLWIADTAATFGSDLINAPIHIVSGPGRGQWRTIVAKADGVLTIDRPWLELPTTESVYQIGGIAWTWKSGTFRWASTEKSAPRRVMTISETTEHEASSSLRLYLDRSGTPMDWGKSVGSSAGEGVKTESGSPYADLDLTKDGGFHQIRFDAPGPRQAERARFVEIELSGVKGRDPVTIYELVLDGGDQ
jgi:hypothetical protein